MNTQGRDLTALQSFSERSDAPDKPKPMCGPPSCILEHKPGRREVVHKTRTTQPELQYPMVCCAPRLATEPASPGWSRVHDGALAGALATSRR